MENPHNLSDILQKVSRTFALTIPKLPEGLQDVVGNAYLLCRLIDSIEDNPALTLQQKKYFYQQFCDVLAGKSPAETFIVELYPLTVNSIPDAEKELIQQTSDIIQQTQSFNVKQKEILQHCVGTMSQGMLQFGECSNVEGLPNMEAMNEYCYYVAGVVGEMLTQLFCEHSTAIAKHRPRLLSLAASFGQGLQMTNILKDVWEDRERGVCWLPRSVFQQYGFDLTNMRPGEASEGFTQGLHQLIGIAFSHLRNGLEYTLLIPAKESRIRKFCLLAINLAALTLKKIFYNPNYACGNTVKISRKTVKIVCWGTILAHSNNRLLRLAFNRISKPISKASAK